MTTTNIPHSPGQLDLSFDATKLFKPFLRYRGQALALTGTAPQTGIFASVSRAGRFAVVALAADGAANSGFADNGVVNDTYGGQEEEEDFNSPGRRLVRLGSGVLVGGMTLLDGRQAFPALTAYDATGNQRWQKVLKLDGARHRCASALGFVADRHCANSPHRRTAQWSALSDEQQKRLDGQSIDLAIDDTHIYLLTSGTLSGRYVGILLRLDWQGEFDPDFGDCGVVLISHPSSEINAFGLALSAGRIIVSGTAVGSDLGGFVAVFDAHGQSVPTFGQQGFSFMGQDSVLYRVSGSPTGHIFAAGSGNGSEGPGAMIVGLDSMGARLYEPMIFARRHACFWGVAVDHVGRPVFAGEYFPSALRPQMVLGRLNAAGRLDPEFAGIGWVEPPYADSLGESVAVQPDGHLLVMGYVNNGNPVLARYLG